MTQEWGWPTACTQNLACLAKRAALLPSPREHAACRAALLEWIRTKGGEFGDQLVVEAWGLDAEDRVGDRKSMHQTSNSSYGTVTDDVRHNRSCRSRTFSVDLSRGAHKIFILELPIMSIPGKFHTSTNAEELQDLNARNSRGGSPQDHHRIFSQGPVPAPYHV